MRRGVAITQRGKGEKGCIGTGNGMVTQSKLPLSQLILFSEILKECKKEVMKRSHLNRYLFVNQIMMNMLRQHH